MDRQKRPLEEEARRGLRHPRALSGHIIERGGCTISCVKEGHEVTWETTPEVRAPGFVQLRRWPPLGPSEQNECDGHHSTVPLGPPAVRSSSLLLSHLCHKKKKKNTHRKKQTQATVDANAHHHVAHQKPVYVAAPLPRQPAAVPGTRALRVSKLHDAHLHLDAPGWIPYSRRWYDSMLGGGRPAAGREISWLYQIPDFHGRKCVTLWGQDTLQDFPPFFLPPYDMNHTKTDRRKTKRWADMLRNAMVRSKSNCEENAAGIQDSMCMYRTSLKHLHACMSE